jgi:hypothetical protein
MAQDFRNQVDLVHVASLPNIEVHVPNGQSASNTNGNPTDNPAPPRSGSAVSVKISGTDKQTVRFQNPS